MVVARKAVVPLRAWVLATVRAASPASITSVPPAMAMQVDKAGKDQAVLLRSRRLDARNAPVFDMDARAPKPVGRENLAV